MRTDRAKSVGALIGLNLLRLLFELIRVILLLFFAIIMIFNSRVYQVFTNYFFLSFQDQLNEDDKKATKKGTRRVTSSDIGV